MKLKHPAHLLILGYFGWIFPLVGLASSPKVLYECDTAKSSEHLFHITARTPTEGSSYLDFQMPAWNALYQIRDFAHRVRNVQAFDERGQPLDVEKLDKQTWRVTTPSADAVKFEYDVYANDVSPYGAQLNSHHAFLNNALVFMYVIGKKDALIEVKFRFPEEWRIATELTPGTDRFIFQARDYDHFVDSPVEIGTFRWLEFEVQGATFRVVIDGESAQFDEKLLLDLLRRIVRTEFEIMRDVPLQHYTFIYHFPVEPAGGGMEHAASTAIHLSAADVTRDLTRIAGVTAHEFFHLWNVKRIRPASLEPVDYTRENYTRALWFSEGVTSLYGAYTLVRSGVETREQFYKTLAEAMESIESRPALLTQSAEESSLDTWFDKYAYYRRPERSISYYEKGEVIGFLLDLEIRRLTENQKSLDDVLRYLNTEWAQKGLFFDDRRGIPDVIESVTGKRLDEFFDHYVRHAVPIEYHQFLKAAALQLNVTPEKVGEAGLLMAQNFDRPVVIEEVMAGGPAEKGGLHVGDELVELNGEKVGRSASRMLSRLRPGEELKIKIRREGHLWTKRFRAAERIVAKYEIVELSDPNPLQKAIREGILKNQ